ncbi:dTDP-glucose 4,6-dehydratase [Streptomyces sp. B1866]|uniref:dTDP-glucose 4,6-dehydratase n=1 Tax=Streptomyces sp. B1866 TaxID=3075431 RepID=UPI00288D7084|nr:dTDP-glucose 4,6-dehydratase [Streptomyces sp. B1866]MDT3395122.1 dTDP-glucose 4,6-dehydratase [Streptomyces sp. B1866]
MDVLVTGGAGFIGSHFVKRLLKADDIGQVTVLDALTYAGHIHNLGKAFLSPRLAFVEGDILDRPLVDRLVQRHDAVVHFAAESHVDRSFYAAGAFLATNVMGTQTLLDAAQRFGVSRFVHVSTDEVYGSLPTGSATEESPLRPSVPYAASKAASDLIALSYWHTSGVPVCVTRASNNYGPNQHPEKIIPLFVTRLLKGEPVTLHGQGQHIRNWLHVADHCAGIDLVLRHGTPGEVYNLGGGTDLSGRELTALILDACGADWDAVTYVPDRPANDLRYSMDCSKAVHSLGYQPRHDLKEGLAQTVEWYRAHPDRWAPMLRASTAQLQLSAPSTPGR